MDLAILLACIIGLLVLWAAVNRPGGPDPENPQEATQALGEGMAGLFGVLLLAVIAIGAVLLL